MSHVIVEVAECRSLPTARALPLADRLVRAMEHVPPGITRFLVAGGLASALNWVTRFPLSSALPYGIAVALAYGTGMAASFGLYRSWVFPGSALPLRAQMSRFVLVNLFGLIGVVFAAEALATLIEATGRAAPPLAEAAAHGVAICVGAAVNFMGHRALTFARRRGR